MILLCEAKTLVVAALALAPLTVPKPQTDNATGQQSPCLAPFVSPSTAYGFLAVLIESLSHARAAAQLEPDSNTFVSSPTTVLYRYRSAADEYHCAAILVSRALRQIRDTSLTRNALLVSQAYSGLGENDSLRADIIRDMLNTINSSRHLAFGTLSDSMGTLKRDSERLGLALGMGFGITVQYFNADALGKERSLSKLDRDSLLIRLREEFGPAIRPKHKEPGGNDYGTTLASSLYQSLSGPHWRLRQ
jgi:hypothetical protein